MRGAKGLVVVVVVALAAALASGASGERRAVATTDLSVVITGKQKAVKGQKLTFKMKVANKGDQDPFNPVEARYRVPKGWKVSKAKPGPMGSCTKPASATAPVVCSWATFPQDFTDTVKIRTKAATLGGHKQKAKISSIGVMDTDTTNNKARLKVVVSGP